MVTRDRGTKTGIRDLAARPSARAAAVLIALWVGTAILLRATPEFGYAIVLLTAASAVLWGTGAGWQFAAGQLILWTSLLAGLALYLGESSTLPGMLALFGGAAAWFVVAEPILRARRPS